MVGVRMTKKVLIVEDNELNMKLFHDLLEAQGYEVTGETGPQLLPDIKTQIVRWARIVKAAGFSSEDRGSTR